MNRKERLVEEFELGKEDEAVGEYEALTDGYLHITTSLIADEVASLFGDRTGVAVDLGAGPGGLVKELATRFSSLLVIGVDISPPMTKLARDRLKADGMNNVVFVLADVHHLPFRPQSVTMVVSQGSIHHWRGVNIALEEIKQVLAEGGFVYLSDLRRDAPEEMVQNIAALLNKKQARAFLNSVRAAYTIEELTALAADAGLTNMRVEAEAFSRRAIAQNIKKLRGSPMKGLRQDALNLRVVSGSGKK
ncbi:MAG: methyltransferase domain-containing protein [Deltaproteobacteria bacterium]|nr:methyltransferase domain-containing protein [Deltaproteobacteria bacterium]